MESENRMGDAGGGRMRRVGKKEGPRRTERAREMEMERCWEGGREGAVGCGGMEGWSRAAVG